MIKRIVVLTLTSLLFLNPFVNNSKIKADEQIQISTQVNISEPIESNSTSERIYITDKITPHTYIKTTNLDVLYEYIMEYQNRKDTAHQMAEMARTLGYDDSHIIIQLAKMEWEEANNLYNKYCEDYNFWSSRKEEYPVATEIWLFLKDLGYNDYVCAGIIGNLMAEVGGNTLDIQYWLYGGKIHYGMCQWNTTYYSSIVGGDLEEQCYFLRDTIEYEINTFGYAYKKDFSYEKFLALQDAEEVALAFAKSYERCNSAYYSVRKKNALKAYEYFVREE